MKIISSFLFAAFSLFIFSCGSEDTLTIEGQTDTVYIHNSADTIILQGTNDTIIIMENGPDTIYIDNMDESIPFLILNPYVEMQLLYGNSLQDTTFYINMTIRSNPETPNACCLDDSFEFAFITHVEGYNNTYGVLLNAHHPVYADGRLDPSYQISNLVSKTYDLRYNDRNVYFGDYLYFNIWGYIDVYYGGELINRYEYSKLATIYFNISQG
jgi:hypothetical protein